MNKRIRVRFAPSPTGPLHIGGVRTALFNYLFAKQNGGDFILRIEDTDQTRFVPLAEQYIIDSFKWLGLAFDEGVSVSPNSDDYRQSNRKSMLVEGEPMYKHFALKLVEKGKAYYAFDSAQELSQRRSQAEQNHSNFQYDCKTRGTLCNSLTLGEEKTKEKLENNEPFVIRFKFEEGEKIEFDDLIRGHISVDSSVLDDKVLFKSDGMPTYHLANVVDDYMMKISHVIRGEEWLPSCPLHVCLYRALGWEEDMPKFAHLPLILKPDGKGKLSKRDGDRLGFPVYPLQWKDEKSGELASGYRESGYLPEAVINMLALLGWNDGSEQEIFSLQELINKFSLERISKHGARFDVEKAKWFNHQYLQKLDENVLAKQYHKDLEDKGIRADYDFVLKVVKLIKERCSFEKELWDNSDYFFIRPQAYAEKALKKRWKEGTSEHINKIIQHFETMDEDCWAKKAEDFLMQYISDNALNIGQIMNSIRLAVVGDTKGPDMLQIMELLGKQEIIERLRIASEKINL